MSLEIQVSIVTVVAAALYALSELTAVEASYGLLFVVAMLWLILANWLWEQ